MSTSPNIVNLNGLNINRQYPISNEITKTGILNSIDMNRFTKTFASDLPPSGVASAQAADVPTRTLTGTIPAKTNPWTQVGSAGLSALGNWGASYLANSFDTEGGLAIGNLFGTGLNAMLSTMGNNMMTGNNIMQGVGANVGSSLASAGMGLAGYYAGKGITEAMGDTKLARGVGAGTASAIGLFGGTALGNLVAGNGFNLKGANPYLMAANVAGAGLGAYAGPSKEYAGKYGKITKGMDIGYDAVQTVASAIPGWGQIMAAAMAVNGGLMNMFGSTSGMTKTDAILGSKFMPFFIKWANMANAKTTDSLANQSWQNEELTNNFMQNGFGDLADVFDKARVEANKTYGTFSNKLFNKALQNMMYANLSWNDVLNMSKQNRWQNIRSLDMTSINNQRYAQNIQGGFNPIYRGKQGMKILNNATNHNIGMRLLSAAALINSKQMILSAQTGTKLNLPEGFLFDTQMPELTVYGDIERARRQNNWLINRGQFPKFYSLGNGKGVKEIKTPTEKGLKIVSPEFYALAGLRPGGDIIAPITKNQFKSIGKAVIRQTAKHPTITLENTASITPEQWNVAYRAAYERGDRAEGQRLWDLYATTKGRYYPGYHGNMSSIESSKARRINPYTTERDLNVVGGSPGYFNSSSENVANTYNVSEGAPTFKTYTFMDNPYIVDANGRTWQSVEIVLNPNFPHIKQGISAPKVVERIRREGLHDGVIIKNVMDVGPSRVNLGNASDIADDIVGFPGRVKLAKPFTLDDNGELINLTERANFSKNDNRYSWLPWFLGDSTAATLYNTNK